MRRQGQLLISGQWRLTLLAVAIACLLTAWLVAVVAVAMQLSAILREGGLGASLVAGLLLRLGPVAPASAILQGIVGGGICKHTRQMLRQVLALATNPKGIRQSTRGSRELSTPQLQHHSSLTDSWSGS